LVFELRQVYIGFVFEIGFVIYFENVGKQAVKKHIALKKPERLWDCVLNGIQNRKI